MKRQHRSIPLRCRLCRLARAALGKEDVGRGGLFKAGLEAVKAGAREERSLLLALVYLLPL